MNYIESQEYLCLITQTKVDVGIFVYDLLINWKQLRIDKKAIRNIENISNLMRNEK